MAAPTYNPPSPMWSAIPGFFDFERLYDAFVLRARDGDVFVEIGSYLGRSACYLGTKLKESGKKATLICVDTWTANYPAPNDGYKIEAPFEIFYANVRQCRLNGIVIPLRTDSLHAAQLVRSNLRCVHIDGDHSYGACAADIKAWLPKVIRGGLFTGHDYNGSFPGVVKAVNEAFGNNKRIIGNCWVHDVPA